MSDTAGALTVGVIGAGSWGTTVAHLVAHNATAHLWSRDGALAEALNARHQNPRYLDGLDLHPGVCATTDLEATAAGADVLVIAVPSKGVRNVVEQLAPHVRASVPILSLTKGLEAGTNLRMSQVIDSVVPGHVVGALTGPTLAREILAGFPAAAVVATPDIAVGARLQELLSTPTFRVYINGDLIGCELGGALKNVIALASGIAYGLGVGDNARAALITRGLAELTRLGVAMGGEPATFAGLAGIGDLIATCISPLSRNRYFGEQLALGRRAEDIAAEMDQVAEGVKSAPVAVALADAHGVEVPIAEAVAAVVAGDATAEDAYRTLLSREQGHEHDSAELR